MRRRLIDRVGERGGESRRKRERERRTIQKDLEKNSFTVYKFWREREGVKERDGGDRERKEQKRGRRREREKAREKGELSRE